MKSAGSTEPPHPHSVILQFVLPVQLEHKTKRAIELNLYEAERERGN